MSLIGNNLDVLGPPPREGDRPPLSFAAGGPAGQRSEGTALCWGLLNRHPPSLLLPSFPLSLPFPLSLRCSPSSLSRLLLRVLSRLRLAWSLPARTEVGPSFPWPLGERSALALRAETCLLSHDGTLTTIIMIMLCSDEPCCSLSQHCCEPDVDVATDLAQRLRRLVSSTPSFFSPPVGLARASSAS